MESRSRPEPMNATSHHPKVKLSMSLPSKSFVAGKTASGKFEMECRADKGLGISTMMVELFAIQELTSRDHSATSTFIHGKRLFQGPGLPPSNAVQPHLLVGDPPLPQGYYQARKGISTFFYRFQIPSTSPASINFGSNLARVRYELKSSVQVYWKGEKQLVTDKREIEVHEAFEEDFSREEPERTVVGENGKIWAQGRIVGGVLVSGESACIELEVKNHSGKRNTGLSVSITRMLHLPNAPSSSKAPLQITDTLVTVPFKGQEYIIPPGAEGVASLVFDVPQHAKTVRGGMLDGDETEDRTTHALFEVQCTVSVKLTMGIGNKDIVLDLPVSIVHPSALPELPPPPAPMYSYGQPPSPSQAGLPSPYAYPSAMSSPGPVMSPAPYGDPSQQYVYLPPALPPFSPPSQGYSPGQPYYYPPPPAVPIYAHSPHSHRSQSVSPQPHQPPQRPSSAGPSSENPGAQQQQALLPLESSPGRGIGGLEAEEGKGQRASRISHHLRLSSRHRSVSPQAHRYPLPEAAPHLDLPPSGPSLGSGRALPVPPGGPISLGGVTPLPAPSGLRISPQPLNLANLPPATEPVPMVLHSPRPMPSPKLGMSPSGSGGLKSERVEDLERMADEVAKRSQDLSGDIPPEARSTVVNATEGKSLDKTLPRVPPPEADYFAGVVLPAAATMRRKQESKILPTMASPTSPTSPVSRDESDEAPPAPVLTARRSAVQLLSTPRPLSFSPTSQQYLSPRNSSVDQPSGLDALEKRLLEQVGTKKIRDRAPYDGLPVEDDSGDGIPIPRRAESKEEASLHDSAISSLSLGVCDIPAPHEDSPEGRAEAPIGVLDALEAEAEDERTHRGKSRRSDSGSGEEPLGAGWRRGKKLREGGTITAIGYESSGKGSKEKRKKSDGSSNQKKKAVSKGRVAEWLGAIDPHEPPGDVSPLPSPVKPSNDVPPAALPSANEKRIEGNEDEDQHKATPNPRSSGFVPKGTFKRDNQYDYARTAKEDAKRVADLWSSPAVGGTNKDILPPSAENPWKSIRAPALRHIPEKVANTPQRQLKKLAAPSPRLPLYPPRAQDFNLETKYDIRSARGGRGGKVTAVAAIWSGNASSSAQTSGDLPKTPRLKTNVAQKAPRTALIDNYGNHRGGRPGVISDAASRPRDNPASRARTTPQTGPKSDTESSGSNGKDRLTPLRRAGGPPFKVTKASSPALPALVSSSHAKPTLSSTASLARSPALAQQRPSPAIAKRADSMNPTPLPGKSRVLSSVQSSAGTGATSRGADIGQAAVTSPKSPKAEMAFGQARLRDLIKKYQGQAA